MTRSTLIFALLSLMLSVATGFVVWQITSEEPTQPTALVDDIELSLPGGGSGEKALLQARSALLYNPAADEIIFEQNAFEQRPIASLTKLMTAMVALDTGVDWEATTTIELREYVIGSRLLLHPGEEATLRDLFYASLLGSANNATLAYVRALGIPKEEFVQQMNRKAVEIGLEQTTFVETTGLDPDNVSTAYEAARLAAYAFENYPEIAAATSTPSYTFTVVGSEREHTIKNSNKVVTDEQQPYVGSKTGYLYEAGYCLVVQDKTSNNVAVIFGSLSEPGHFADIQRLLALPST